MKGNRSPTLADLGELRLIDEILLPLAREYDVRTAVGDDCTYIAADCQILALTADVGPKPLLHSLSGYESDLEAAGWLSVVATASDLAAAGVQPLFLTNCVDAPPDLSVSDFTEFMRGYFQACAEFGFQNGGGDVRHGPSLAIRVFGGGALDHAGRIGRGGAVPGDHLVLIGPPGQYMATYLLAAGLDPSVVQDGRLLPEAESILRFPKPQLQEMKILASHGLVAAASDTSDSLLGAIDNIARSSNCGFELELHDALLPPVVTKAASIDKIEPWNIFFSWGDWAVAAAVRAERFEEFQQACVKSEVSWRRLGLATSQPRLLTARLNGGDLLNVVPLRNENFVPYGFNAEIEGHLDHMLLTSLFSATEIG